MTNYRILFSPSDPDGLQHIMDNQAKDLDAAEANARAFLCMLGPTYHSAEIFEEWRTMWRSSGRKIITSPNL